MAGSVVRTLGAIKHFLTPASGLLTSRQITHSVHRQLMGPATRSHFPRQHCCQRCAKSSTALSSRYGAGFSSYRFHVCVDSLCVNKKELQGETRNVSFGVSSKSCIRMSQKRNKSKSTQQDDKDEDSDSDQDDALDDDDFDAPPQFKVQKVIAPSNRADAVISHALNISRNQLEEVFLKSGLYLNGDKLLKKSTKMDAGDYADIVFEKTEDQLKVKRVKVLKVYPNKTGKDNMILKVRIWKVPFLLPKPEFKPHIS